jgi:outer membrane cobalamin receptor
MFLLPTPRTPISPRGLPAILALLPMLATTAAWAQTAPAASSESNPEQITVTGKRLEETLPQILEQQGTRIDTVTAEEIAKGGYIDIAQSLGTTVPGLYISPKNGPFDYVDVSLQGSRTEDLLWLIDGIRINNRLYGGTTPLDTLPATIVDRIEVLEGGQALFYGTQAVSGAVNIVTKGFSDTPQGSFSIGGDTNTSGHVDGYYSDSFGRSHFVIFGDVDISAGFQPFRTQDYQPSSTDRDRAYSVYTSGAKYAYDVTDDLRVTALFQDTQGKLDFSQPELVQEAFNQRDENLASLKIDYTPNDAFQVFAKGYYHSWASHYTEYDNVVGSPGALATIEDHGAWGYTDAGLNLMTKVATTPWLDSILGYDYQAYSGSDAVLVITQKSESVNALFGHVATTSNLVPDLKLAAGFRYNVPSFGESATVWNVSGKYDFSDDLFLRGTAGTAFRLPTAEELFANDPDDERGDPNLKPESSIFVNASIGGALDDHHLTWEVVGFARNVSNLIDFGGFDAETNQALFANVPGLVRVRGGELVLTAELSDVSATGSYTYTHSTESGGQQIDRVPAQEAKATIDYHPATLPFGLTASAEYVGRTFQSGLWDGREAYGSYPVVDFAGRVFLDPDRHHTVYFRVENIFDRQYATSLGTAERDADGSNYTYGNLGVPRTLEMRYTYKF